MELPVEQSTSGCLEPINCLMTGVAVNFLYGPVLALAAVIASIVLPILAATVEDPFVSLDSRGVACFTQVWKELGWSFAKWQVVVGGLLKLSGATVNQTAIHWIRQNLSNPLKTLFCYWRVAVIAPVVEEVVFRGFLQNRVWDIQTLAFGAKAAASKIQSILRVVIQAICFGLAHYHPLQGSFNVFIVCMTGLIGFCCGCMREETGTINQSVGIHSLINISVTTRLWVFGA